MSTIHIPRKRRGTSILFRTLTVMLLGIVMGVFSMPAFAVDHSDTFELEGDAMDDVQVAGDDWSTPPPKPTGSATTFTDIIVDRNGDDDIFTKGKSKVPELIEDWEWKFGGPPEKTDITNAYAANYNVWDADQLPEPRFEQVVYFGADLYADNGDAELAFWFFQNKVERDGQLSGGFTGSHANGDVYLAVKFSNGGKIATGQVYEWDNTCNKAARNPGEGDCAAKNIRLRINAVNALCDSDLLVSDPSTPACVITNTADAESPWDYTPKSGTDGWFPATTFFEGGINIRDVFDENKCFSSFMAMSGASTSFTSTAKDFALGDFDVCSVDATKICVNDIETDDAPYDITYNVRGCALNDGGGTINVTSLLNSLSGTPNVIPDNLAWYEPPETFDPATDCGDADALFDVTELYGTPVPDPGAYDLGIGEALVYYFTEWSSASEPTDTVTMTAEGVGGSTPVSDIATDTCPELNYPASINVAKACTADLDSADTTDRVVVRINVTGQVCNDGDIDVYDLALVDSSFPEIVMTELIPDKTTLAPGECTDYHGYYYPASIPTGDTCPFADQVTASAKSDLLFTDGEDSPLCRDAIDYFLCTNYSNSPTCLLRATDGDGDCATGPVDPTP